MTERWKSTEKHWCTQCRIYIQGNRSSVATHEKGQKHKESAQRAINALRKKRSDEEAHSRSTLAEVQRIEKLADQKMKGGHAPPVTTVISKSVVVERNTLSKFYENFFLKNPDLKEKMTAEEKLQLEQHNNIDPSQNHQFNDEVQEEVQEEQEPELQETANIQKEITQEDLDARERPIMSAWRVIEKPTYEIKEETEEVQQNENDEESSDSSGSEKEEVFF